MALRRCARVFPGLLHQWQGSTWTAQSCLLKPTEAASSQLEGNTSSGFWAQSRGGLEAIWGAGNEKVVKVDVCGFFHRFGGSFGWSGRGIDGERGKVIDLEDG